MTKSLSKYKPAVSKDERDRIIEMAWEDRTPFDAIQLQFQLKESEVIQIMRSEMKPSSFRMWRERVNGRRTKHAQLSVDSLGQRFACSRQKAVAQNKISKR